MPGMDGSSDKKEGLGPSDQPRPGTEMRIACCPFLALIRKCCSVNTTGHGL